MKILRAEFRHFRGFEAATILSCGHVALVGEPGAGRSDVVEGLERVLSPEATRSRFPSELDFHNRDTAQRAEVEIVLGDLGRDLEQAFFDVLEVWNRERRDLVESEEDPEAIDRAEFDFVVRLCYRARWDAKQEQGEHWVDYPKNSDPAAGHFERVPRADREALKFSCLTARGRVLDLTQNSSFRRLVEGAAGEDFSAAIRTLETDLQGRAAAFSETTQLAAALESLVAPIRVPLGLGDRPAAEMIRFMPEGGSVSGLLRSLSPSVELPGDVGPLPVHRQGSTALGLLTLAQAMAVSGTGGIIVVDDLGEGLDAASSHFIAATLRRTAAQCWASTRRSHVAEAFEPEELVRLARDQAGTRGVFYGKAPKTKAERLAARHRNLQLLPAVASRAVLVVEGPHDSAALRALALKAAEDLGESLPVARGVSIIDGAAADGAGGSGGLARLAASSRQLGLRTIAVLDHDGDGAAEDATLQATLATADVVVRLPNGHAIELALLSGLDDTEILASLKELQAAFGIALAPNIDALRGKNLLEAARKVLKSQSGFHAQFIETLGAGRVPVVGLALLRTCLEAACDRSKAGHIQL